MPRRSWNRHAVLAAAAVLAPGCAGILGLDATSLDTTSSDASTQDAASRSDAGSASDAAMPDDAADDADDAGDATAVGSQPDADAAIENDADAGAVRIADAGATLEGGPSGTPDGTFQGGYALDMTDPVGSVFNGVAVDSTGRVVAGGSSGSGGWLLRRFLDDGSADTTFDTAVSVSLPTTGALNGLTIDPATQYILCTGTTGATAQLTILVFDQNGHVAGSFNNGTALVLTPVQAPNGSSGAAITLSSVSESFVVVGSSTNGEASAIVTAPTGESSTPAVSNLVKYGTSVSTGFHATALQGDGRVVAAGVVTTQGGNTFLARFGSTGALDPALGDAGGTLTDDTNCPAQAVAVAPHSGAIVVTGTNPTNGNLSACFVEWSATGVRGWWKLGQAGGGAPFNFTALAGMGDANDRMYSVGYGGDMYSRSATLIRFAAPTGDYDTTFGPGATGQVTIGDTVDSPPDFYYVLKAVAVDRYGRIVVAGSKTDNGDTYAVLGRFWP